MARRIAPVQSTGQISLAASAGQTGLLGRLLGRGGEAKSGASMRVAGRAIIFEARSSFRGKLEIPLECVRKALVDDGSGWTYATAVCRFAVYDSHADGTGTGALVGPLWSTTPSLLPETCPALEIEPVPGQAPNIALILDPCVVTPLARDQKPSAGPRRADAIAVLFARAEDPADARDLLAGKLQLGRLDLDDLAYLSRPMRLASDDAAAASA